MSHFKNCEKVLTETGFTRFEAATYVFLLRYSPATGYKVAKGIGTSYSNAYKILKSLEKKGYVLVEKGANNQYRAIPIDELLKLLEKNFAQNRSNISNAFSDLPPIENDHRIYQLKTLEQVYTRSENMLNQCKERALAELFPEPLNHLKSSLEKTAARGCKIAVRLHKFDRIKGVKIIHSPYGEENISTLGAQWLSIYVDGLQYLQAVLFNQDKGVVQAVWSENPLFARAFYSYLNSDLHHYAFQSVLKSANSLEKVRASYNKLQNEFPVGKDLGFKRLLENIKKLTP